MPAPRFRVLTLALLAPLAACDETVEDNILPGETTTARATYYDDVLPVLTTHCVSCHTEGGIAPFPVDDYEQARAYGPAMAVAARVRTMPPFSVDASGDCNTYAHAQWMTDEEIAAIEQWVDDGYAIGDESAPRVEAPEPVTLRGLDVTELATPDAYTPVPEATPGGELEDYQCFYADYDADRDRFIVGFDVLPGNLATVHHVLVMEIDPEFGGNGDKIAALDAASPDQVGWDCYGGAGDDIIPEGVPVAWAPGQGAVNYPEGTGIRVEAGHKLVIQMHYNLLNDDGTDMTRVHLDMADEVEREGRQTLIDPFLFSAVIGDPDQLEPGLPSVDYSWELTIGDATFESVDPSTVVDVYGVLPHMHTRGRSMSIDFEVAGEPRCGAIVDRWDFDWQRIYFYDQPLTMTYGDKVAVTCEYDTSDDTAPVLPGFGTADEMCLLGLYVVPR